MIEAGTVSSEKTTTIARNGRGDRHVRRAADRRAGVTVVRRREATVARAAGILEAGRGRTHPRLPMTTPDATVTDVAVVAVAQARDAAPARVTTVGDVPTDDAAAAGPSTSMASTKSSFSSQFQFFRCVPWL